MNLSPSWVQALEEHGHSAVHWLGWARDNGYVVFTNYLDFGAILAATGGRSPSVVQVRAQDLTSDHLIAMVAQALSFLAALTSFLACGAAWAQTPDALIHEGVVAGPSESIAPAETLVRVVAHGFTAHEESQRMRAFFDQGNAITVRQMQERIAVK